MSKNGKIKSKTCLKMLKLSLNMFLNGKISQNMFSNGKKFERKIAYQC